MPKPPDKGPAGRAPDAGARGAAKKAGADRKADKKKNYYTTAEAATYLDCTPGHIRKLVQLGYIKPAEKGKRLLFTGGALYRYKRSGSYKKVGRPIGSGEIKRDEEKRAWWREYMRRHRAQEALEDEAKAGGKKRRAGSKKS